MEGRMKKFTLIELLIVIAIIGILLTILMPSLSKAKEKARTAVCASNQSQVFKAASIWSFNNNKWTPYGHSWHIFSGSNNLKQGSTNLWMAMGFTVRDEIITSPEILNCPSSYGFKYGTVNNPFNANWKPNITSYNFTTSTQQWNTLTGKLAHGSKKFFISMFENEAVSMDAYWRGDQPWKNYHETYSNVTYSAGHVKVIYHKSIPARAQIASFSTSFNNITKKMWKERRGRSILINGNLIT